MGRLRMARDIPNDAQPEAWCLAHVQEASDCTWLRFQRHKPKGARGRYVLFIRVLRGRAHIIQNGQVLTVERDRRKRITDLAHQAIAYATLMGTLEGFPEQEEI